jgi:hypothetical protein
MGTRKRENNDIAVTTLNVLAALLFSIILIVFEDGKFLERGINSRYKNQLLTPDC